MKRRNNLFAALVLSLMIMIAVVTMFIDHFTLCFLEAVKGPDGRDL